ncbi:MAG: glycosyltransferase family 39 protein [Acidobacteriota bacterium]
MSSKRQLVLGVFLGLALLFFLPTGWRALWSPDEGRYAEIPRAMVQSGDWVTPRIDGIKFFDKPPLAYWCEALAIRVFGTSERSLRLVPVGFGLLGVLAVFLAGRRLWGTRAGLFAAVILGTSPLYFAFSGLVSLDIVVSSLLAATLLACLAAMQSEGKQRDRFLMAFYASAALATLAKGLIGIVLPGLVIVPWLLLTGRWREILRGKYRLVLGTLLFLAIALPWHVLVQQRNPEWAWYYFVHEHFLRFTTHVHKRSQPIWFYLPVLLVGLFPWITLLPGAARRFVGEWRDVRVPPHLREARLFLVLWALAITGFFSISGSKLIPYVVPALPAFAMLLGEELSRREGLSRRVSWWTAALAATFAAATALTPLFAKPGSSTAGALATLGPWLAILAASLTIVTLATFFARRHPLALAVATGGLLLALAGGAARFDDVQSVKTLAAGLRPRLLADDLVVAFDGYPRDLPFYVKRRVAIAGWVGDEIDYGSKQEDMTGWLYDFSQFRELWDGPRRVYAVLDNKSMPKLEQLTGASPRIVSKGPRFLVAVNRPD